jgi:hypothetical protein
MKLTDAVLALSPRVQLRRAFVGEHGTRSGWRVLAFFVLTGALQIPVVIGLGALGVHRHDLMLAAARPSGVAGSVALGLAGALGATSVMALLERRRLGEFGLAGRGQGAVRLLQGCVGGVLLMAALAALLLVCGGLSIDGVAARGATAWRLGLAWAGAYFLVALFEESMMRGYLLHALTRGVGFRWAAVLSSALFAAGHLRNAVESPLGLVSVALIGLVLSYSVRKLGSLWWAIGFHTAWNWTQAFVLGVATSGFRAEGHLLSAQTGGPAWLSGGATGPEASVWNLLVILATAGAVYLSARAPAAPGAAQGR